MRAFTFVVAGVVVACGLGCGPSSSAVDGGGACGDTGKTPANLLTNPGFDCGSATPAEWTGIYGTTTFPTGGHAGREAHVVVDAAGGRLGYTPTVATAAAQTTYCARAWVKGTAPYMRLALTSPNQIFYSSDQVTSAWVQVPFARATLAKGETLSLMVEAQTARSDNMNAQAGDVLEVDDVDVWESSSGRCDER
jgi:hypothetical protein